MSIAGIAVEQTIQLSRARRDVHAWRELTTEALRLLGERDRQLKSARETIEFQRLEIRALKLGRTIAEQREAEGRAA